MRAPADHHLAMSRLLRVERYRDEALGPRIARGMMLALALGGVVGWWLRGMVGA